MSTSATRTYWRVGYHRDPVAFTPLKLCSWNHRFDDLHRRFRSLYTAEAPETALREVLADLRPNAGALRRYVERFGAQAAADVPGQPVTAAWRRQHVLAEVSLELDGPLVDLCDVAVRDDVERRHAGLLEAHGLDHLDLSEVTSGRRAITQAIASDLHARGAAAAVRFPSRLDGNACVALFEGRARLELLDAIALVDPAPEPLAKVAAAWQLALAPAP